MKQYKIEIFCAEDFVDKGVEVLYYIEKMLKKKYGEDAEWIAFGSYIYNVKTKAETDQIPCREFNKLKTQVNHIQSKIDKLEYKVNKGVNKE
jgi:hypothetical protein